MITIAYVSCSLISRPEQPVLSLSSEGGPSNVVENARALEIWVYICSGYSHLLLQNKPSSNSQWLRTTSKGFLFDQTLVRFL